MGNIVVRLWPSKFEVGVAGGGGRTGDRWLGGLGGVRLG